MVFTTSNDMHCYAPLISVKNNETLFYWHLHLQDHTLLRACEENDKRTQIKLTSG